MFSENFVEVRYYDSLETFHSLCWDVAQQVMQFLLPNFTPEKARRNTTWQQTNFACGEYVLHYWEGEVRQHLGQGWIVGRPWQKIMRNSREKLMKITQEIVKFIADPPKIVAKKTKSKLDLIDFKEFPEEGPRVPRPVDVWTYLEKEASMSLKVALVPFYGCSKCRMARGGCIFYMCSPEKFQAHFNAFPEKCEGKILHPKAWKSISMSELEGSS